MTSIICSGFVWTVILVEQALCRHRFQLYDVVVEDISLVVNFRSQFQRILVKGSFDDLLNQLRAKEMKNRN
ncbi:MAG TPA: ABC transporter substrate-binding protein [Candidatus Limnocylindria bacterium]|nr:ABC transporter substrate-binding protein [Candidatus Limnocylindria bacterium]